jgi:hypothetical protein
LPADDDGDEDGGGGDEDGGGGDEDGGGGDEDGGGGVTLPFLPPLTPKAIVSIPPIRSTAASIIANRPTPKRIGFAIIKRDTITLNAPTPISKPLEDPELSLEIP